MGPRGPKGATGEKGATGATGPVTESASVVYDEETAPYYLKGQVIDYQGNFYYVTVDNPAGTPGSSADYTPVQLSPNVGATGPQGVTGSTGPGGEKGDAGDLGPQGLQGLIGPTGPTGSQGPAGVQGLIGPIGASGPTGAQGVQGDQGIPGSIGPSGPQGVQGDAGTVGTIIGSYDTLADLEAAVPTGTPGDFYYVAPDLYIWNTATNSWTSVGPIAGPQGIQGFQGIPGAPGPTGAQGIQGIQGPAGAPGSTGAQGVQGPAGLQGIPGAQGVQGLEGPVGPPGNDGAQGPTGSTGATGEKGETGPSGPQGPAGTLSLPTAPPGSILYVAPDGTIQTDPNFTYSPTASKAGLNGVLSVNNANIPGGVDPLYVQLTQNTSNPDPAGSGILWVDTLDQLWVDNNLVSGSGGGGGGAPGPTGPKGDPGPTGPSGLITGMTLATISAGNTSAPLNYPSTLSITSPSTANAITGPVPASPTGFTTAGITTSVTAGPVVTVDATNMSTQLSQNTVDISFLQNYTPGATSTGIPTTTGTYSPSSLLDPFTTSNRYAYSATPVATGELFFGKPVYRAYYCFSFSANANDEYWTYFPSCQTQYVAYGTLVAPTVPSGSLQATSILRFGGSFMNGNGNAQYAIPATYYYSSTVTSSSIWGFVSIDSNGNLVFHSQSNASRTTSDYVYLWIDFTTS